jgi:cell division protein FtsA
MHFCLLYRMSKNITVGIDIGSHGTRVMVVEYANDGERKTTRIIGTGYAETRGVRHGYVVNGEQTSESLYKAIRDAEHTSGIRIRQAVISIGGISLSSHLSTGSAIISKADNEVTNLDIQKALNDAESKLSVPNKHIIETVVLEYKLDGKKVLGRPEGMKGIKLDVTVLFIACLKQHIDDLISVVNSVGVDVIDVVPSPLAASHVTLSEKQKTAGCMLLDIGAETVSLTVFEDNNVISMHVFTIGGSDITNDIALGLKIPLPEAEEIKQGVLIGNISQSDVENIIEARLTDIFELVQKYLKKIKRDGLLPAGVIISGGASQIPITESLARKILNVPASLAGLPLNSKKNSLIKDMSWLIVYGLCMSKRNTSTGNTSYNPLSKGLSSIGQFFKSIIKQLKP